MDRRLALLIATDDYLDPGLRRLEAPAADAEALAAVLRDPAIAGFDVTTLINEPHHVVGKAIGDFYRNQRRDDLALLYFTGHGLKDDDGRLHLAMRDTSRDNLLFTALTAGHLDQAMQSSRSRQVVLILDCCYSGAFPAGAKGDTDVHALDTLQGRGRTVLTASDAMQYSFEGEQLRDGGVRSVFTRCLVEGLRDGSADLDGDGDITLDELYTYVHDRVVQEMPHQRPKKQDNVEGRTIIARNINWRLPDYLRNALDSPIADARLNALEGLAHLYRVGNQVARECVRDQIQRLAEDDSRKVSTAAVFRLQSLQPASQIRDRAAPSPQDESPTSKVESKQLPSVAPIEAVPRNPSPITGEPARLPLVREAGLTQLRVHAAQVQVPYWAPSLVGYLVLTDTSGAPLAAGDPIGYVLDAQQTQHIIYRGVDNHLHELQREREIGDWNHIDLTNAARASVEPLGVPAGYVFDAQQTQHIIYRGVDNHLYELQWNSGQWSNTNLMHEARAPNTAMASGDPAGYIYDDDDRQTQHVVYRGVDNHLHDLEWDQGEWTHTDLTETTGIPWRVAGDPAGYVFYDPKEKQQMQHVLYRDERGHIVEHFGRRNRSRYTDLTEHGKAPLARADPFGYVFAAEATQHVIYRGNEGHIHELWWPDARTPLPVDLPVGWFGGYWSSVDLTKRYRATGVPTGYVIGETQHVVYRTANGHVHEISWGRQGRHRHEIALTYERKAPMAAGNPMGYFFEAQQTKHVVYRTEDGRIVELCEAISP